MKKFNFTKIVSVLLVAAFALAAFTPGAQAAPAAKAPAGNTIVDIAVKNADFSTLVAAVSCTGLVPALSGKGQLTVFAPTNAAFAKLGLDASNICSLPKAALTNILLYHVANGARYASSVASADQIRMLSRDFTEISASGGKVFIDNAQITTVNIKASNGVIHVIDTVLMP